eukprot:GHVR01147466.1.p1 GENE.GHVR01147466.1~~GHVR01147466.1.p1  ORF type:complete len:134 (+),score=30.39 GHVR01147466.1:317-718(+)
MTNFEELKDAVIKTLEANGMLATMKAQMRASVYKAIDQESTIKPLKSRDNNCDEVMRFVADYLKHNGYEYTLSVFTAEANFDPLNSSNDTDTPPPISIGSRVRATARALHRLQKKESPVTSTSEHDQKDTDSA